MLEVCSNHSCSHEKVLMCLYFDQSHANREGGEGQGTSEKSEEQKETCPLFTEA